MAIWSLIIRGSSVSKIAENLKTTRQYVNQTRIATEAKLSSMLLQVAEINDLQVHKVNPRQAILLGYSPALQQKAIVTYTTSHGLKVWFWHDTPEDVTDPILLKNTCQYLIDIAREHGLEDIDLNVHPGKLAKNIFCKLLPELKM